LIIPLLGGIGAVAQVICGVVSTPHTVYNLARGRTWDKVDRCYRDSSNLAAEEARVRASNPAYPSPTYANPTYANPTYASRPKRRACVPPRVSSVDAPTHAAHAGASVDSGSGPNYHETSCTPMACAPARRFPLMRSCLCACRLCFSMCSVRARWPFERRVQSCNRIRAGQDGRRCRPALCRGKQYAGVGVAASHPHAWQRAACTAHDSARATQRAALQRAPDMRPRLAGVNRRAAVWRAARSALAGPGA
jgi:hypothetical protein